MSPTYGVGDNVRVDLDAYDTARPQRGDVVSLHPPKGADLSVDRCGNPVEPDDGHACEVPTPEQSSSNFIKRVVAIPGDWLEIKNHRVYLATSANGPFKEQNEPFLNKADYSCDPPLCNLRKPITVRAGHYFVMGDNRAASDDSRKWGPVRLDWIVGKVVGKQ